MAKGFFRELKHYKLNDISFRMNIDSEEAKRLVGILKRYGIVKAVKTSKPEFEELSNADIILAANEKANQENLNFSLYGTNSFNLVWEKVCAENFGSVLNKRLHELPLGVSAEYEAKRNKKLIEIIDSPKWYKNNPYIDGGKVDTLKPDLICIYPSDDGKYCFLRQCFEGKEDISSMASGNSLDKLVEKVMELIREVYL